MLETEKSMLDEKSVVEEKSVQETEKSMLDEFCVCCVKQRRGNQVD